MILRNMDFGPCLDASGTRGFFGRGYLFHRIPFIGGMIWDFKGSTFVAKTTTTYANIGNMPLRGSKDDFEPFHWFPKCIWSDIQSQIMLNSVALAGPGALVLFGENKWQQRGGPFMLSWMPIGHEHQWEKQARGFVSAWKITAPNALHLPRDGEVGLQVNITCPNTGADLAKLADKAHLLLDILQELGVPLMVKLNLLVDPRHAVIIASHPACDGICISNTVPFGELPDKIDWEELFPIGSPLRRRHEEYGGGGLSGKPLLPLVAEWLVQAFDAGLEKPVNAGGGILEADDVDYLVEAGGLRRRVDSVFIGSIAILNPLGIRSTIRRAHKLLG